MGIIPIPPYVPIYLYGRTIPNVPIDEGFKAPIGILFLIIVIAIIYKFIWRQDE